MDSKTTANQPTLDLSRIEYREAEIGEILRLRHDVLIVGTDRKTADFTGDGDASSRHFGAFDQGMNVCCLSFMLQDYQDQPAYQLRGMATHPPYQSRGVGKRLIEFAEARMKEFSPIRLFWCNARVGVEDFYRKQGWEVVSEPFMIPGVCMHVKMIKPLDDSQ